LPKYVQRKFEAYLKCGRLEHGFLRVPRVRGPVSTGSMNPAARNSHNGCIPECTGSAVTRNGTVGWNAMRRTAIWLCISRMAIRCISKTRAFYRKATAGTRTDNR
jgi:hypothetical protein